MNNLLRTNSLVLVSALTVSTAWPQQQPSFEAASVKLSPPIDFAASMARGQPPRMGAKIDPARIEIRNMSLRDVTVAAYRIKPFQLDGPAWTKSTLVDITATFPDGAGPNRIPEMLQALLSDRFGLALHKETRDVPVYELSVGKNGSKLQPAPPDPDHPYVRPASDAPDWGVFSRMSESTMSGNPMSGQMVVTGIRGEVTKMSMTDSGMHLEISRMDLPWLTSWLSQYMDRPVIDKTGLEGEYRVALDASLADMMNFMSKAGFAGGPPPGAFGRGGLSGDAVNPFAGSDGASTGSTIAVSLKGLGLQLTPAKAPLTVLIIDRLNKTPTEN